MAVAVANGRPWAWSRFFRLLLPIAYAAFCLAQSPITFRYYYDDLNQLTRVIDSTGIAIQYVYDSVGNILQINRTVLSSPGVLSIFNATPQSVGSGTLITIQGQGFSTTPSLNVVKIGGVAVTVVSANATTLVVLAPASGLMGQVSVTVGSATATSDFSETVIPVPALTSLTPHGVLAGTTATVSVTGVNLAGSSFSLTGGGTVTASLISGNGTSATLTVTATANANGRFAVVAANSFGDSGTFVTNTNAFGVFSDPSADSDNDGLPNGYELLLGTDPFNPDSDGDGFSDGVEVASHSDPLDAACTPLNCRLSGESESLPFSLLNDGATSALPREVDGRPFSVLNGGSTGQVPIETDSIPFSVLNGGSTGQVPIETDSIPFSVCAKLGTNTCSGFGPLTLISALQRGSKTLDPPRPHLFEKNAGPEESIQERFSVLAVSPSDHAANVALNATVTLVFSSPLDVAAIRSDWFLLRAGDERVGAQVLYSGDLRSVTLIAPFPSDSSMRVEVLDLARDVHGRHLPPFNSVFHTATGGMPMVVGQRPANGSTIVSSDALIHLFMAKAVSLNVVNRALHVSQNGEVVEGSVRIADGGRDVEFRPYSGLLPGACLRLLWRDDSATDRADQYEGLFTVASASGQSTSAVGSIPGSTEGIPTNSLLEVDFGRSLDASTLSADSVQLVRAGSPERTPIRVALRGSHTIRIVPFDSLTPETGYQLSISRSVRDLRGQSVAPFQSFVTTGKGGAFEGTLRAVGTTPADGAIELNPGAEIRLSFDRPVNPLTVTRETVQLIEYGTPLDFDVSLGDGGRDVLLIPIGLFRESGEVTVVVSGIEDWAGNAVSPFSVHFKIRGGSVAGDSTSTRDRASLTPRQDKSVATFRR